MIMNFLYYWAKFLKKFRGKAIFNSQIHKTSKIEAGSDIVNSIFQRHSFCGYDCEIINCDIGSFCSIANNVKIGGGMHPIDWVSTSPVFYEDLDSVKAKFSYHKRPLDKRTIIGHDVWIGSSSIIKQGVKIGTGAVIGMGSIVTKDVEPYSIVAGCPAKQIKKRFDNDTIKHLIKSQWWDFSDSILRKHAVHFNDISKFLENINSN
jgi:chloramphenicol O-acetyltransferase type B